MSTKSLPNGSLLTSDDIITLDKVSKQYMLDLKQDAAFKIMACSYLLDVLKDEQNDDHLHNTILH